MGTPVLHTIKIGTEEIKLFRPAVKALSALEDRSGNKLYWTRIWPSAIALSRFILANPHYILNKKVLELGAGLGLPSFVAARYAGKVCCSDSNGEAVRLMQQSIDLNNAINMDSKVYDWFHLPQNITTDLLLLSDINYNPQEFDALYEVLSGFLQRGCTIILSTPQRLLARPFLQRLLLWCTHQEEIVIPYERGPVFTSIFVLKNISII